MNKKWYDLMVKMVEVYGVRSALDNVDVDHEWTLEDEGLWFECPECGEPILEEDYTYEEACSHCPVCEETYELD